MVWNSVQVELIHVEFMPIQLFILVPEKPWGRRPSKYVVDDTVIGRGS